MDNPIATDAQRRIELEALKIWGDRRMQEALVGLRQSWLDRTNPGPSMRKAFESKFDEVAFGAIIWSLNTDPERPEVITISRIPHKLEGRDVPGSRWGLDNPDSIYRVIPISGAERYVIRGRVPKRRVRENYFTLWDAHMGTVDVLDGKTLQTEADGSFEIFVDAEEKGDRRNHIRSSPEAVEFYIRDVVMDWADERPNELSIERLGGPPRQPERSFDRKVDDAVAMLTRNIDNTIRWNAQTLDKPANGFDFTIDRDSDGALRNQIYIMGNFRLAEDEALVIDVNLGGASYFIAPVTNWWGTTNDITDRNGSLNLSQAVRNDDGTVTFVLSEKDPGIFNWVDPCDMPEGILTLRWAEFENDRAGPDLSATGRVVKLDRLDDVLPAGTRRISAEEREAQQRERAASYAWRIAE